MARGPGVFLNTPCAQVIQKHEKFLYFMNFTENVLQEKIVKMMINNVFGFTQM
jgi:hypothetical protein